MKEHATFRLDPVNQCLWRRNDSGDYERVLLTPTQYGVLDHLVEHAGRLVTHRELLDAVWPHTAIEPQAVKSKIFHLRRVLDDDPKQPRYIETLSRRGYRFVGSLERGVVDDSRATPPSSQFVGREAGLAELQQHMRGAVGGKLQIVFVTGEPGLGKTALVEEFGRLLGASERPPRMVRGQCVEGFGSKEPFYPVLEAVGELCRRPDGTRVVEVLASHAPTWLVQFPAQLTREHRETLQQEILGATRERMLREICEGLETIAAASPVLLVLEDLHWADSSTLDLISALARRRLSAKLMIVGTYRPSDVARSAQPLHALKRDLVARSLCRELVLQPLGERDIARYLSADHAVADVPDQLASLLHRHTEGNPLFMVAVLEHLAQRGLVERDHGVWRLRQPALEIELEVPESLRQMIGAQIERMSKDEQHTLEIAAIAGLSFAPAICAPMSDLDERGFEECCDALARRGHILRVVGALPLPGGDIVQRYAFLHALYREVLYERLPPARRAMLHRRRAERIAETFAATIDDVASEVAFHYEKGADWPRAVEYLRRAADVAATRCSIEGVSANLERALGAAAKLPIQDRAQAETEILDRLADLYLGTFDARAVDVLGLLRERAAEYGLIDVEAKALVSLGHPLAWVSSERALEVIDQALRLSEAQSDPVMRARTRAGCMVRRIWIRGWNADDAAEGRRALEEIQFHDRPRQAAWHVLDCNFVDFFSSEYRRAAHDAVTSLATLAEGHHGNTYLSFADSLKAFSVSWSLTMLGEWGAAFNEMDTGIALAEKNADRHRGETLRVCRAWALLCAMDFAGAREASDSLLRALPPSTRAPWRRFALTIGGAAEAFLGNHQNALERLRVAGEEMDRQMVLGDWYWRMIQQWGLANLWLSKGDLTHAGEAAERFLARANATAEHTWRALALDANARIALASGDAARARELATQALDVIQGFEAPVAAWQAHATAADALGALGDPASAANHRSKSRVIVLGLAESLGPKQPSLRQTFLAAPAVARVMRAETPQ